MENTIQKGHTLKLVLNILFWVMLVVVLAYSVLALFSKQDSNKTTILGISALTVQSGSMSGTFEEGDLIFIKTNFDVTDLDRGDVITYSMIVNTDDGPVTIYNTHTIMEKDDSSGNIWFTTHGDANPINETEQVFETDVVGVWTGRAWSGAGTSLDNLISFLKSGTGFFLFIVLPVFGFLVYQVIRFIKLMTEYNTQKALSGRVSVEEEAIRIARAQIEAEMREKALKEQEPKEEAKEEIKE